MEQQLTGYPSIDKPWVKYYTEAERNLKIPDGTMYDYMYQQNADYPDDIAIEYYGRKYTYRELFRLTDQCCRNLSALGIKKGDVITVQAIPQPQAVVIVYALTRLGACGNMLYPDAKAGDVVASMQKTHSRVLMVVDRILSSYEKDLPESFDHTIILLNVADQMSFIPRMIARKKAAYTQQNHHLHTIPWTAFISGEGKDYQENHDGTIPAFMLRTGGTTGYPKEVVLNSRNFNAITVGAYKANICTQWERQKTDVLLLPPFIAFGIGSGIHDALSFGLRTIITLDISPVVVSKLFLKYKPSYIIAGTVQVEQLITDLQDSNVDLSYIQLLSIGGESMNHAFENNLLTFLSNHNCTAIPLKGYGLTETAATVTMETLEANHTGSVGIPFALCNMKVVDPETGKELTYDTLGEICLSTPGLMKGYYQNQEATNDIIEELNGERWLHTGDVGFISRDGMLTVTGRIKRIIVCKEGIIYHKVFPQLIEDQLGKADGVHEITIVGKHDNEVGNVLVAYYVTETGSEPGKTEASLRDYASSHLETFERPVEYVCMGQLPRTLIGKVDFRKLEAIANNVDIS